jgi:hypothetical protein
MAGLAAARPATAASPKSVEWQTHSNRDKSFKKPNVSEFYRAI